MKRWVVSGLAVVVFSALLITTTKAETIDISMIDFKFEPEQATVNPGDTVVWTNRGFTGHTSTSGQNCAADGRWDSGLLAPGESFSRTFDEPGTFPYFCAPHCGAGMMGTIIVAGTPDESDVIGGAEAGQNVSVPIAGEQVRVRLSQRAVDANGRIFITLSAPSIPEFQGIEFTRPGDAQVLEAVRAGRPILRPFIMGDTILGDVTEEYYYSPGPLRLMAEDTPVFVIGGLDQFSGEVLVLRSYYWIEGLELTMENLRLIQRITLAIQ